MHNSGSSDFDGKTYAKPQSGKEVPVQLCDFAALRKIIPLKSREPQFALKSAPAKPGIAHSALFIDHC
jgi:hypothetical protein